MAFSTTIETLNKLANEGPAGNRWFKVNLHVHGEGNDPAALVAQARAAGVDLVAITDHQSFRHYEPIADAARSPGPTLTLIPGIEVTSVEGVHVLGIFSASFTAVAREHFLGWLEIAGDGDTRIASRRKLSEIFEKVNDLGGIIVVPHPFTDGMGMLDSARKIGTKVEWLESGYCRLMQVHEEKVRYLERDEAGNWLNRYVLASSRPEDIASSTYCLAPFNRSDAHKAEEVGDGCSWFRMQYPNVEGLRQVACEPRTRISRVSPPPGGQDCILAMRVTGGYCDGQVFRFNESLNCLVGENYAGKSTVLDLIRFGLGQEEVATDESRERLLTRLYGILKTDGTVELYLRRNSVYYVVRRTFRPQMVGRGANAKVERCIDNPSAYRFERDQGVLVPDLAFQFPIEVYEQGRIHRLRDDSARQLDMLDAFANNAPLRNRRAEISTQLNASAERLHPLYEEREQLQGELLGLPEVRQELEEKEKLVPGQQEQSWANSTAIVKDLSCVRDLLDAILPKLRTPTPAAAGRRTELDTLFSQQVPSFDLENAVLPDLLQEWVQGVRKALEEIDKARLSIVGAIEALDQCANTLRARWEESLQAHNQSVADVLSKAGVESPRELIARVATLRIQVHDCESVKRPRLCKVKEQIDTEEATRSVLLADLEQTDEAITRSRLRKARDLTDGLDGHMRISLDAAADRAEYKGVLNDVVSQVCTGGRRIQNRECQLESVISKLTPMQLAKAIIQSGEVSGAISPPCSLSQYCGITENTQGVLCLIANDILLLDRLQTLSCPDVPKVLVRRRGETSYADLRTALSQGEQSAAILTLALQSRSMPLILDQPEDELGYAYVVHLVVPKILRAKFARQLLVVTHNANVPVLGDVDYVIKMENRPCEEGGRLCVIAQEGGFEAAGITQALIELEGGPRAFQFRQHRYALPPGCAT